MKPSGRPTFEGRKVRPNKEIPFPEEGEVPLTDPHTPPHTQAGKGEFERLQAAAGEADRLAAEAQAYREEGAEGGDGGASPAAHRSEHSSLDGSQSHKSSKGGAARSHTRAQAQEFAERGTASHAVSELDRGLDRDFFASLSTSRAREQRQAPWAATGAPLLLASVCDNSNRGRGCAYGSTNSSSSSSSSRGASASSVDVQMIMEELGAEASVIGVYCRDEYGRTPVHLAALNGCPDTVYQLLNSYRRHMYRTGVLEHVVRLNKERAAGERELRSALIRSGAYTAQQWDLKAQRMRDLAAASQSSHKSSHKSSKGASTIPQLAALEQWYAAEVGRLQRAHEVRVEVYRTRVLCTRDRFGRTPLHCAAMSGCPDAVMHALLQCSTANIGGTGGEGGAQQHGRYNYSSNADSYELGLGAVGTLAGGGRRPFQADTIYESATGMEIGRTDGSLSSSSAAAPGCLDGGLSVRQKEATRLINRSLRNVAWELTRDQPSQAQVVTHHEPNSSSAGNAPAGADSAEGSGGGGGEFKSTPTIVRSSQSSEPFEEEQERMFEVMLPWLCRNLLARVSDYVQGEASYRSKQAGAKASSSSSSGGDAKDAGGSAPAHTHAEADAAADAKPSADSAGLTRLPPTTTDVFETLQWLLSKSHALQDPKYAAGHLREEDLAAYRTVLLLPEVMQLLFTLGIQVTSAALNELCRRYPAPIGLCNSKWAAVRAAEKERVRLRAEEKVSRTDSQAGGDSKGGADDPLTHTAEAKSAHSSSNGNAAEEQKPSTASVGPTVGRPDRSRLDEVISHLDGTYWDTDVGLDTAFFLTELQNGRAVQGLSALQGREKGGLKGTGNDYTRSLRRGVERFCGDDAARMAELHELLEDSTGFANSSSSASGGMHVTAAALLEQLSSCVTVSSIWRLRRQVVNVTDTYGRTPLLIAAANGHKSLVQLLLSSGGDTTIPATYQSSHNTTASGGYRYNALSLAATGSIRSLLEKALLRWLNRSDLTQFRVGGDIGDIGDLLNSLSGEKAPGTRTLTATHPGSGGYGKSCAVAGMGLGVNEAYMATGDEDLQYFDSSAALAAKSALVLGMQEHLRALARKNWAYSRCPLGWAVTNGLVDLTRALLAERANPDEADTTGRTALHEVASIVSGCSRGGAAVAQAAVECAQLLLQAGADAEAQTVGGRTPMHELFARGQDDAPSSFTNILSTSTGGSSSGVSGSARSGTGGSQPTRYGFAVHDGLSSSQRQLQRRLKRRFLRLLLQFSASTSGWDRAGFAPIHYAARENDAGCVLEMLRYASNGSSGSESSLNGGDSLSLSSASSAGDRSRSIIRSKGKPAGAFALTQRTAQTPLHVACKVGAVSVVQLLCRWEGDLPTGGPTATQSLPARGGTHSGSGSTGCVSLVTCVDSAGKRAQQYLPATVQPAVLDTLWRAAYHGHSATLRALLTALCSSGAAEDEYMHGDADADADTEAEAGEAYSGGDSSSGGGQGGAVDADVHNPNNADATSCNYVTDPAEARNYSGRRAAAAGARGAGDTAHEPWLVDSINAKTRTLRWTALFACLVGWVRAAAESGSSAARRVTGSSGRRPVTNARKHSSIAEDRHAYREKYLECLHQLLRNHSYVDGADRQCRTPLMLASAAGLEPAVSALLLAGADPLSRDLDGNTALHMAYAYSSAATIVQLERAMQGGEVSAAEASNHVGSTPLDMAGYTAQARALLG